MVKYTEQEKEVLIDSMLSIIKEHLMKCDAEDISIDKAVKAAGFYRQDGSPIAQKKLENIHIGLILSIEKNFVERVLLSINMEEYIMNKSTGIIRRVDDLGRIVIPKEIRRIFKVREGDPMEIFVSEEGILIKNTLR